MAFDSFFVRTETAPVVGVTLKETLTAKLSWKGEYDRLPLLKELPLKNAPIGPTEMRVFNAILNGEEGSTLTKKIITEFEKRYDTEYALLSMIKAVSARRSILSGLLARVSGKVHDEWVAGTLNPLYTAIQGATSAVGNLYVMDEELQYWIQQIVASNNNARTIWKNSLYEIFNTISELEESDYIPSSWAYLQSTLPDAQAVYNDPNALAWQVNEQYVIVETAYSILEEDI